MMETAKPFLDYISSNASPRELILENMGEVVRVTFPVGPRWAYLLIIEMAVLSGFVKAGMAIWIVVSMRRMLFGFHIPSTPDQLSSLSHWEIQILLGAAPETLFWWVFAGFQAWKLYRFGRVPRVLTASREGLVLTWLGWFRLRERNWPAADIAEIKLRRLKDLNWKRASADLFILGYRGRLKRLRLQSSNPALPDEIAQQLATVLGRAVS